MADEKMPQQAEDEVAGHRARFMDAEQAVPQPEDDENEVAGHRYRSWDAEQAVEQPEDNPEDDVEGHGRLKY